MKCHWLSSRKGSDREKRPFLRPSSFSSSFSFSFSFLFLCVSLKNVPSSSFFVYFCMFFSSLSFSFHFLSLFLTKYWERETTYTKQLIFFFFCILLSQHSRMFKNQYFIHPIHIPSLSPLMLSIYVQNLCVFFSLFFSMFFSLFFLHFFLSSFFFFFIYSPPQA